MPRGRPEFRPTTLMRRAVEQMAAVGERHETIARAIGISGVTLAKYFAGELLDGRSKRRREVVDLLFRSARSGNVSAQKKLEEMTGATPAVPQSDAPKIGKKERANVEAENAAEGTSWDQLIH
jgi:hypothetical protein